MPPIRDIQGVYCPMGCGETLHLMQSNMILCLNHGCSRPDAAQVLLSNQETDHIVHWGPDHWTVIHPLRDRLGDLPSCPVHEACSRMPGPPGGITGRYRVRMDGGGGLEVELLEDASSQN